MDTIVDENHFTVKNTVVYSRNANYRYAYFYPLQPLPQSRSGKVNGAASKFDMGDTDGSLTQTPMASPTVFNFFYPDYKYPGEIASANVTSPEFQLTTDTNIVTLTNTLNQTFLYSGNPNGLCSFNNGSLMLDLSAYMAAPYSVADVNGVTSLVNTFSDLLTGGQLTSATKTEIVNYITGSTTSATDQAELRSRRVHQRARPRALHRPVDHDLARIRRPTLTRTTCPGSRPTAASASGRAVRLNSDTPSLPMLPEHYSSLRTRRSFIRQALCATVGTAALSNTIRDLRLINAAMAQSSPAITDYKALVCVYLQGGNDSNNLFIPTIPAEWSNYAAIRTPALAIPNTDGSGATALALNNLTSDGHTYGIHPAAPELQSLFNNGKMAAIFNVGTLVYPLTKADYSNPLVGKPLQLFSHVDQTVQWQTSVSDRQSATGWGGRCADLLDTYNPKNGNTDVLSMSISLAGANVFEVGGVAQQYAVSTGGVVALNSGYTPANARTAQGVALNNILGIDAVQSDMLTRNYSLALEHALASGSALSTALSATKMASTWSSYPTSVTVPNGGRFLRVVAFVAAPDGRQDHRGRPAFGGGGRPGHEAADFLRAGGRLRSALGPDEQFRQQHHQQRGRRSWADRRISSPN